MKDDRLNLYKAPFKGKKMNSRFWARTRSDGVKGLSHDP